ncbi:MAG TPA: helix-turn-helix domain-containing protein [Candidatus Dormibacteraeota bacterium]|nr:helix-turn-helix domain-containing protein [Candidatus Dormibacteraeota bacterium]
MAGDKPSSAGPDAGARGDLERTVSALRDPTRRTILLSILRDREARTVDDVAAEAGVHRTVAFGHLERLVDLGYLEKGKRRSRVGKPAALYAAATGPLSVQYPARQFEMLASLLASGLGALGDAGVDVARDAGRRFGESCAARRASTVAEALVPLAVLGAEHSVEGGEIVATNCVFLEACAAAPGVVCALHAGILEGALHGAGLHARVDCSGARPPAGCAFAVTRA